MFVHAGAVSSGNEYRAGVLFKVDEVPRGCVGEVRAGMACVGTGLALDALLVQQGCGKNVGVSERAGCAVNGGEDGRKVDACDAKPNNT